MSNPLQDRCHALLQELGLIEAHDAITATALTGGVASDIAHVQAGGHDYCVKFALPKLRVKAEWYAPVERNLAEYRWLETYASIDPEGAIPLFGHSPSLNGFVMGYLSGPNTYLLKSALFDGNGSKQDACNIGRNLGRIHQISTKNQFDQSPFDNRDDFYALRIEPYLIHTAKSHDAIANKLTDMADLLYHSKQVLVHGDVSPKNILIHDDRPYILDAECATMGDASFDVSFCLNHFILKALHVPSHREDYLGLCDSFWQAYKAEIDFEDLTSLERRISQLIPMLLLARVGGKSPVEYLTKQTATEIRQAALSAINYQPETILQLIKQLHE